MFFRRITLFKTREIGRDGRPYLTRYILFRCASLGIYLHQFHRSDFALALHDHPWPFVSILFPGGYLEWHNQTLDGSTIRV